jgi:hypothetical protein
MSCLFTLSNLYLFFSKSEIDTKFVPVLDTYLMSMLSVRAHVHASCHVLAVCSCDMSLKFKPGGPCCLSTLLVHAPGLFCMSVLHVHAACPCCMSMLHVPAACPYCLSICFSVLHVHAAYPWCMSLLHVMFVVLLWFIFRRSSRIVSRS